jgi:hypothetical protein
MSGGTVVEKMIPPSPDSGTEDWALADVEFPRDASSCFTGVFEPIGPPIRRVGRDIDTTFGPDMIGRYNDGRGGDGNWTELERYCPLSFRMFRNPGCGRARGV